MSKDNAYWIGVDVGNHPSTSMVVVRQGKHIIDVFPLNDYQWLKLRQLKQSGFCIGPVYKELYDKRNANIND